MALPSGTLFNSRRPSNSSRLSVSSVGSVSSRAISASSRSSSISSSSSTSGRLMGAEQKTLWAGSDHESLLWTRFLRSGDFLKASIGLGGGGTIRQELAVHNVTDGMPVSCDDFLRLKEARLCRAKRILLVKLGSLPRGGARWEHGSETAADALENTYPRAAEDCTFFGSTYLLASSIGSRGRIMPVYNSRDGSYVPVGELSRILAGGADLLEEGLHEALYVCFKDQNARGNSRRRSSSGQSWN